MALISGVCGFGSWNICFTTLHGSWNRPCWNSTHGTGSYFTPDAHAWIFRSVFLWDRNGVLVACIGVSTLSRVSDLSLRISQVWIITLHCCTLYHISCLAICGDECFSLPIDKRSLDRPVCTDGISLGSNAGVAVRRVACRVVRERGKCKSPTNAARLWCSDNAVRLDSFHAIGIPMGIYRPAVWTRLCLCDRSSDSSIDSCIEPCCEKSTISLVSLDGHDQLLSLFISHAALVVCQSVDTQSRE